MQIVVAIEIERRMMFVDVWNVLVVALPNKFVFRKDIADYHYKNDRHATTCIVERIGHNNAKILEASVEEKTLMWMR